MRETVREGNGARFEGGDALPPFLRVACDGEGDRTYAARLVGGETLLFSAARVVVRGHEPWVRLSLLKDVTHRIGVPYPCPQGVDVRLSALVWVAEVQTDW